MRFPPATASFPAAILAMALCLASAPAAIAQVRPRPVELSGIPALSYDADEGFGYGAILALYRQDPTSTTYAWTLQPTLFLTTEGRRDYTVFLDAPSLVGGGWRVTGFAGHEEQLAAPYYGIGNGTAYDPSLEAAVNHYYYRYGRKRNRFTVDLQHALWRPAVRVLIGANISQSDIRLSPFDDGPTLVQNQLTGAFSSTGRTNYLRTGATWDTRDRETGTRTGTWADVLVQRVDRSLGASASYTRWTATARHFEPIADRLTFANRLLVQNTTGDVPFYELNEVQTTQKPQEGLGGASTVRGLPKDRYAGKGILVSNNELRWRALDFQLGGRSSSLVLSGFVDTGRVWTDGVDLTSALDGLHTGYGGGVRLAFGSNFVIAADVGHSAQATAPRYIGLGYLF